MKLGIDIGRSSTPRQVVTCQTQVKGLRVWEWRKKEVEMRREGILLK